MIEILKMVFDIDTSEFIYFKKWMNEEYSIGLSIVNVI